MAETSTAAFVHTGLLCGGVTSMGMGWGVLFSLLHFPPGVGICHSSQTAEPIWVHVDLGFQGLFL